MEAETLLSCMVPPTGYRGDFGYICGFTAHRHVLAEVAARFTAGVRLRRVALAAFFHPPETHFPVIPGLQVLYLRARPDFALLHAKVALLRFVDGPSSIVRLLVSTGNWTHETLSDSIDLYWMVEWNSTSPDAQAASDIIAAAGMFDWLSSRFESSVLLPGADGVRPEKGLNADLEIMRRRRGRPTSRFVSNIERPLLDEVLDRVGRIGQVRRNRLIMGSGFFESGRDGVLAGIAQRLREAGHLTASAAIDVVLNPLSCQGLATQAQDLAGLGAGTWTFRAPRCEPWQAKLHAKFLFSAGGRNSCTNSWCYLGSGNLTRQGMLLKAGPGGNLEAGVVFTPDGIVWDALEKYLPINFNSPGVAPGRLEQGDAFEHPGQGVLAPPVSYLEWREGWLYLPEATSVDLKVTIVGPNKDAQALPCAWNPAPPTVTLFASKVEVPVWTEQGFVLPPLGPMRIEDVLAALPAFPDDIPRETDSDVGNDHWGAGDDGRVVPTSTEYPIRRIMRLITALCDRQPLIEEADWPLWSIRCEELLVALAKLEADLFVKVHGFGIDPLDALIQSAFLPPWIKDRRPIEGHAAMLERVRLAWGITGLEPLFEREA